MTWMAVRAIEHGMGAIVIDPKGDRDLRRELRDAAQRDGQAVRRMDPAGTVCLQPLRAGLGDGDRRQGAGRRALHRAALPAPGPALSRSRGARAAQGRLEVSLEGAGGAARPDAPGGARAEPARAEAQGAHDYLDSLTTRQQSDLAGRARPAGDHGRVRHRALAGSADGGRARLDLLEAAKAQAVVYFNLEADRRPLLAQMLGAAIVQDLQAMVAALQGRPRATLVMIDEFSAIVPERVVGLFARAGGAGMSLLLGTQELADLRVPGREMLLEQVMGNLSVLIAHRQVVPASAELIAEMTETRGVWRTSHHSDGRHTRTREHENVLRAGRS